MKLIRILQYEGNAEAIEAALKSPLTLLRHGGDKYQFHAMEFSITELVRIGDVRCGKEVNDARLIKCAD